jgi:hypothetical protein
MVLTPAIILRELVNGASQMRTALIQRVHLKTADAALNSIRSAVDPCCISFPDRREPRLHSLLLDRENPEFGIRSTGLPFHSPAPIVESVCSGRKGPP